MKSNNSRRKHLGKTKDCLKASKKAVLDQTNDLLGVLPIEVSVLLETAEILALVVSEEKVRLGWLYFVMGKKRNF